MKDEIILTEMPKGYDGNYRRVEVMPFDYEPEPEFRAHSQPGLYLQFVAGCGYDVFPMTAGEAEALAAVLLRTASESRKSFERGS